MVYSVARFGVNFGTVFLKCVRIVMGWVGVAWLPPFAKTLLPWFAMCSLCILSFCGCVISNFGFEVRILVLVVSIPGHC